MRPVWVLAVMALVLGAFVVAAPAATAIHRNNDDFFGSSFDNFFGGKKTRDRDRDDDDRSSRSRGSSDTVRVELTDGRLVRVDRTAYDMVLARTNGRPTDADILEVANLRDCEMVRDGRVVTEDCSTVRRAERQILRELRQARRDLNEDRERTLRKFDRQEQRIERTYEAIDDRLLDAMRLYL